MGGKGRHFGADRHRRRGYRRQTAANFADISRRPPGVALLVVARPEPSRVPLRESAQDDRWMFDVSLPCIEFQRVGRLGCEVAEVLVDVDSRADAIDVQFWMELRGIYVGANAKR